MSGDANALYDHLATASTTVCRAWRITRRDGQVFGFTDHDADLHFDGAVFRADSGMTARAFQQTTGLSVDNSEAQGILSHSAIREEDIVAGRFDAAGVEAWLVNWANPDERALQFRGMLGDITRAGGAFTAELRGLTEALNQTSGRLYQRLCPAILGDRSCKVDLDQPGFSVTRAVEEIEDGRLMRFAEFNGYDDRWFEKGRLSVLSGRAVGIVAMVKADRLLSPSREIELWQSIPAELVAGDLVRLETGCDKRAETCRLKFNNFLNFRGFPHIPGEDWLTAYPSRLSVNDGGSLR